MSSGESAVDRIDRAGAAALAADPTCLCGAPIVMVDYDSTRGIRWGSRLPRAPLTFECANGHQRTFFVTARVAASVQRKIWAAGEGEQEA